MNILMTNDDGIGSEGLQALAALLRLRGKHRVFVIAPDRDRSGVSHGFSIFKKPVKLTALGDGTWSCSGTPADCAIAGIMGALPQKPDLVLSGINRGGNLGTDIIYSGTAAAARQASLAAIPSVALSLVFGRSSELNWDMAASYAADHLEEFAGYWREDAFVNVNIPNGADVPLGIIQASPAVKKYRDALSVKDTPDGGRICFLAGEEILNYEPGSDCDVVSRNYTSISAIYNHPIIKEKALEGK
jgi:5'-nucleotidase